MSVLALSTMPPPLIDVAQIRYHNVLPLHRSDPVMSPTGCFQRWAIVSKAAALLSHSVEWEAERRWGPMTKGQRETQGGGTVCSLS